MKKYRAILSLSIYINGSRSQNGGQKRGLAHLTLSVVVELLNAALAASTDRVILPSVLFPRASLFLNNL